MNAEALGELALREIVFGTEMHNLDRQPSGQGRPFPLRSKLRVAKIPGQNLLVRYELIEIHSYPFGLKITNV